MLTAITTLDKILIKHEGEDPAVAPSRPQTPAEEPQDEEDPWELPELTIRPKMAREKIFYNTYKIQQRINKCKWIKSKLRKTPGYVSDEGEFLKRKKERDNGNAQEGHSEEDEAGDEDTVGEQESMRPSISTPPRLNKEDEAPSSHETPRY